ncbi:MAG: hypothetical protein L3J09_06090 [Flavobacteriaceae bacterium]|nr:hypothetical protein [Flavobacteriaceae bacterium]
MFLSLMFVVSVQISYGQTYNEEETNAEIIKNNEELKKSIFANLGIGTSVNPRNSQISGNTLFLTQIGEYNTASIITETNASEININQNGDVNTVDINYVANTAIANLTQNGNNNRISDFVRDRNADISLDLIQYGDGLIFVRKGVNSLTKSLKFRQTEASPILIIKSYF